MTQERLSRLWSRSCFNHVSIFISGELWTTISDLKQQKTCSLIFVSVAWHSYARFVSNTFMGAAHICADASRLSRLVVQICCFLPFFTIKIIHVHMKLIVGGPHACADANRPSRLVVQICCFLQFFHSPTILNKPIPIYLRHLTKCSIRALEVALWAPENRSFLQERKCMGDFGEQMSDYEFFTIKIIHVHIRGACLCWC